MKDKVFKLLGRGLSAAYVIDKTGFDKDTVYAYRREYYQTHEQKEDGISVAQRYDEERTSTRLALDRITDKAFELFEYAENEIKDAKKKNQVPDKFFLNFQLQILALLEKLHAAYRAVALLPDSKMIIEEFKKELKKKKRHA